MKGLRRFLIGITVLVISIVSVIGGGLLSGTAYAKNVMWKCKNGAGVEVYCTQDGSGNNIYAPEGFTPNDLPEDLGANDIQKYWQAWEKEKETGDSSDKEKIMDAWQVSEESKTANEVNGDISATAQMVDTCSGAGGAKSLGWVVCPLMAWFGDAAEGVYNDLLKPSLEIDPLIFTGSGNENSGNATRESGWAMFRDIANGIFIVFFLVVIFSQLTGVGIDNYGIKKVLPKIIVAGILINLSYWICVVFVDLSNILGNGLQAMFDGLASGSGLKASLEDSGGAATEEITSTIVSLGILAALTAGGGVMVWSNPALVLTLFITAIGVLVAFLFLYILLAAREAAIVVLVVISPIAVVCYMLPNTKKFFEKWVKLFEGLLLVYPISGLLVGGGNYVSKLLLAGGMSGGGTFAAFTAMIVGAIPVFFIPSLLRNSFNAMGRIGARITSIGNDASRRVRGGVMHSAAYQDAAMRARETRMRRMAGVERDADGNLTVKSLGRWGTMVRGGRRNIQRSQDIFAHHEAMTGSKDWDPSDTTQFQRRLDAIEDKKVYNRFSDQFANMSKEQLKEEAGNASNWLSEGNGETRMNALINAMNQRGGMENDIFNTIRANNVGSMSSVMEVLAGTNNKVLKAYGKSGNGVSYESFMRGFSYQDAAGNLTDAAQDENGNANTRVQLFRDADSGAITTSATSSQTGSSNSVVSMQHYASDKGGDFVDGLDDKALRQINNFDAENRNFSGNSIMSTEQLVQAATTLKGDDALAEVNRNMGSLDANNRLLRGDLVGKISGEQFVKLNDSTMNTLLASAQGRDALQRAARVAISNPQLRSKINDSRKLIIRNQLGLNF